MIRKFYKHLVVLAVLIISLFSLGLTVEKISLREMTIESELVVLAKVKSAVSLWEGNNIYTYTDLEIISDIKGDYEGKTIKVKQIGGTVGDMGLKVDGTPELYRDDEVLLFLTYWKNNYWIHSIALGCYYVEEFSGQKYALNDFNRFEFTTPTNKVISEAEIIKPEYELGVLIAEIENILGEENAEGVQ